MPEFKKKEEYEEWKKSRRPKPKSTETATSLKEPSLKTPRFHNMKLLFAALLILCVLVVSTMYFLSDKKESPQNNQNVPSQPVSVAPLSSNNSEKKPQTQIYSDDRQASLEALKALRKLEARCQVGISYRDYPTALGETKYAVNTFIEGHRSERIPDISRAILMAMDHYENAYTVWKYKFKDSGVEEYMNESGANKIISIYPIVDKYMEEGGAADRAYEETNRQFFGGLWGSGKSYRIDRIISIIWGEASKELSKASSLLQIQ